MRKATILLGLLAALAAGCGGPTEPTQATADKLSAAARVRQAFIARGYDSPAPSEEWIEKQLQTLIKYSNRAGIPSAIATEVALFFQESKLGFEPDGPEGETGFGQVSPRWRPHYQKIQKKLFGPVEADEADIALAVAAFWENLRLARGDLWEACRRYNGSGPEAHAHADAVMVLRGEMFGDLLKAGR